MQTVLISAAGLRTTSLGFGCAKLMRVTSSKARERLLGEAWDAGIRHFDVARSYGFGVTERELGRFLRRRRPDAVVATKFGIEVRGRGRGLALVQGAARQAVPWIPGLRHLVRRGTPTLLTRRAFDATTARASLETSLRELGLEHVDILLLHEPEAASVIGDDLVDFFEEAKRRGLLRTWGPSGEYDEVTALRDLRPALAPLVQFPDDAISNRRSGWAGPEATFVVTYAPLSSALDTLSGLAGRDADLRARWRLALDFDPADRTVLAPVLLRCAMDANAGGTVLFSTTKSSRISGLLDEVVTEKAGRAAETLVGLIRRDLASPPGVTR